MKRFTLLLFALFGALSLSFSQTGNGVLILAEPTFNFDQTTVDSTASVTLQLKNAVGAAQTIYFGGLDAPFSLADNTPIEIPSQDTVEVVLNFTPAAVGNYSDTLEVIGNIFGSAQLIVSGQGIQVQLEWSTDLLVFDTTPIGQSSSQTLELIGAGNGTATIDAIEFTNEVFSIDSTQSSFNIPEGEVGSIVVNYSPVIAGELNEVMILHTNSPINPIILIALSANGVSEISGDVCGLVWTIENSPYLLVGDISIPSFCAVDIGDDITVDMQGYSIEISEYASLTISEGANFVNHESSAIYNDGELYVLGAEGNPVHMSTMNIVGNGTVTCHHCEWEVGTSQSTLSYSNDFTSQNTGWTEYSPSNVYEPSSNGYYRLYYSSSGSSDWDWHFTSPVFSFVGIGFVSALSFELDEYYYSSYDNRRARLQVRFDGGAWTDVEYLSDNRLPNQLYSTTFSFNLSSLCQNFQFRIFFQDVGGMNTSLRNVDLFMVGTRNDGYAENDESASNSDNPTAICSDGNFTHSTLANVISFGGMLNVSQSMISAVESHDGTMVVTESVIEPNGSANCLTLYDCIAAVHGCELRNGGAGIYALDSEVEISHSDISDNSKGVFCDNSILEIKNTAIQNSSELGIFSNSVTQISYSNIAFNGGTGLVLTGNSFHTLNNSILWGNNSSNYTQIDIGGGVISTSYSTVQGRSSYGTAGSGQYYWGEGVIEADPLFADDDLHLEIFSPCVDGGQSWHQDAHMPYGLGGVRADMGMYGGPDNAYWGGDALPDGASVLSGVSDSPQDQGGVVGLVFDASFYDNSDLVNNVTSYAFWRHYDPTGGSIGSLDEGNWELIGEMPAQSFNGYAYQAPTLGNTNSFGTFNSCYTVVAHTDDEDTYWYSNVMCGESVDNLAPDAPEVNGLVVEGVGAQISWEAPLEPDYAYTEITNPDGYLAELGTDTVVVDPGIALGEEVTYSVRHFDVNGNASPAVQLTLLAQPGLDIIPLAAGWNLISTDRMPADASAQEVFSGLAPGNLQYVTGFDGGVTFYDPDGFQFLNSLEAIEGGKGYWVKVLEADTLEVAGAVLGAGFESALTSGWNLIGYAPAAPASPASFFNELIAAGELEYVTGFDGGSQFFDPNGLPFLNSLEALKNGFGYWVKVAADYNPNGMAPTGETKSTPTFMLINGTTNLPALAGSTMEVINEAGEHVATAELIAGGYIMTTPLFGDDPSTSGFEGLELGETLRFKVNGMLAEEAIEFTAGMDLKKLILTFPEAAQHLSVFPNPASDRLTISGTSPANTKVSIQILDPTGRVVLEHDLVSSVDDWSYEVPAVSELAAGLYSVRVTEADGSASTVTWVRE